MMFRNTLRAAAAAVVTMTGAVLAAAPQASAGTGQQTGFVASYMSSNGGELFETGDFGQGLFTSSFHQFTLPDTAITAVGSSYEIALQGANNDLWMEGAEGVGDQGLGMMPGTAPAITAVPGVGWQVAFQANTGEPMAPSTSPSIAELPAGGSFQMVWEGANHDLWTSGPNGGIDLGVAMMPGTSPALAELPSGGYAVAYQDPNGLLNGYVSPGANVVGIGTGWQMWPGTSPAIVAVPPTPSNPSGSLEAVFHGADGRLWGSGGLLSGPVIDGGSSTGYPMWPGTSPSINSVYLSASLVGAGNLIPGYQIAFQASNGTVWVDQASPIFTTQHKLIMGTVRESIADSPSITAITN